MADALGVTLDDVFSKEVAQVAEVLLYLLDGFVFYLPDASSRAATDFSNNLPGNG